MRFYQQYRDWHVCSILEIIIRYIIISDNPNLQNLLTYKKATVLIKENNSLIVKMRFLVRTT